MTGEINTSHVNMSSCLSDRELHKEICQFNTSSTQKHDPDLTNVTHFQMSSNNMNL